MTKWQYSHEFTVSAPIEAVRGFHFQTSSMAAITPPGIRVHVTSAPEVVAEGLEMSFVLRTGPIRIPWVARFSDVNPAGFVDTQTQGPFAVWRHRHAFLEVDNGQTKVVDTIEATPGNTLWSGFVSRAMWVGLPALFWFRARQTRLVLEANDGS